MRPKEVIDPATIGPPIRRRPRGLAINANNDMEVKAFAKVKESFVFVAMPAKAKKVRTGLTTGTEMAVYMVRPGQQ